MHCDHCQIARIDGVVCHEIGCSNARARWDADERTWVRQRQCFTCGCTVDESDLCCDAPEADWPPDADD